MQNDWFDNNRRFKASYHWMKGRNMGLGHSTGSGIGHPKCDLPCTLSTRAHVMTDN